GRDPSGGASVPRSQDSRPRRLCGSGATRTNTGVCVRTSPSSVTATGWGRAQLPPDGAGAGAHDLAQPRVALHADGIGAADRDYVDPVALALLTHSWAGTAPCRALGLSAPSDAAVL